jgi:hypothetical protein
MYKSEAEQMLRRAMEEAGCPANAFTDQAIEALSEAMRKIASRITEEALSMYKPPRS